MNRSNYTLRRLLALVLALVMIAALFAGCSKTGTDDKNPSEPSETIEQTEEPTDEPTEPPTEPPTEAPTEPEVTVPPVITGTVNADNLNVRSDPDTTADILKRLAINTRVEVLEQKIVDGVNWGRIAEGWVNMNYITIGDNSDTSVENNNNIGTGSVETPTYGVTGTITATDLNIRKSPDTASDKVGSYKKGDRVTILEKSGDWGRTDKGWISLKYVSMDSTGTGTGTGTGSSTGSGSTGTVTATELNIRKSASADATSLGVYKKGDKVTILEKSGGWGRTDKGWINLKYVSMSGSTGSSTTSIVSNGKTTVLGYGLVEGVSSLNVRSGPGTSYDRLTYISAGQRLPYYQTSGNWARIKSGWVSMSYFKTGVDIPSGTMATVTASNLNIRESASASSKDLGNYKKGERIAIEEINGNWGRTADGWVSLSYVVFDVEGSSGSGTTGTGSSSSGTGTTGTTKYAISIASATNGSVKASASSAKQGTTITLTISPKSGYALDTLEVKDAGGNKISVTDNKFSMPASKVTVTATFKTAAKSYTVTLNKPTGGTVTANYTSCAKGTTVVLTVKPSAGYKLMNVTAMNTTANEAVAVTNGTFTMPEGNVNVVATFVATTEAMYSVSVSYGANGKVVANTTSAAQNDEIKLTITPNSGYELASLVVKDAGNAELSVVDGKFTMPGSNVTVYATFRAKTYTVTTGACTNGSVSVNPDSYVKGATVTPTVNPATGYKLKELIVTTDGGARVTATNGKFLMPADNVTVTATFVKADYTITVTSATNGTVTADAKTAQYGNTVNLTISPKVGYVVDKLVIKNTTKGTNLVDVAYSVPSFEMPDGNVTITVTFKQAEYTITSFSSADGIVKAPEKAKYGVAVTMEVTPAAGKTLDTLTVTDSLGRSVAVSGNKFTMPAYDVTITATFK